MLCVKVAGSLVILFDFLVHGERTENGRFMASLTVGSRDLWDTAWVLPGFVVSIVEDIFDWIRSLSESLSPRSGTR